MSIQYKDINTLTQKEVVSGEEKIPVSDTEYVTTSQLSGEVATQAEAVTGEDNTKIMTPLRVKQSIEGNRTPEYVQVQAKVGGVNASIGAVITITNATTGVVIATGTNHLDALVPYGTNYTISASSVDGYFSVESVSYVAALSSREVTLNYVVAPIGVYIITVDKELYTSSQWSSTNGKTAVGIYVGTSAKKFIVDIATSPNSMNFTTNYNYEIDDYDIGNLEEHRENSDNNGKSNTTYYATYFYQYMPAIQYATSRNLFGKSGYILSSGECYTILLNSSSFNACKSKLGITYLNFYTSTRGVDTDEGKKTLFYCSASNYYVEEREFNYNNNQYVLAAFEI